MTNDNPVVLYHSPCKDGTVAAWAVWRKYPNATFIPCKYDITPVPEAEIKYRDVVLLDFSFKRNSMLRLIELARSVVVLDHHKSALAELTNLVDPKLAMVFDVEKSGARLAWEYFYPGEDVPALVQYVEDRDLWRWSLPNSREVNAALASHDLNWTSLNRIYANGIDALVREGATCVRVQDGIVKSICENVIAGRIAEYRAGFVNTAVYQSEVGAEIVKDPKYEIAVMWFVDEKGNYRYSLRSGPNGPDVSLIASSFGGGGHAHAAGLSTSQPLPFQPVV